MDIFDFFLDHIHITLVLVTTLLVILAYFLVKNGKSPPGPRYIPFLGIIPGLVGNFNGPLLSKWAEEANSNILCLKIVGVEVIVISSYDSIKETFEKRSDLSDHEEANILSVTKIKTDLGLEIVRVLEPKYNGIALSSGQIWHDSKRVTLRRMRGLASSTSSGQQYIIEEAEILMKKFEEFNGKAINPKALTSRAVANVTSVFAFGKRFEYGDHEFEHALKCINSINGQATGLVAQFVLPFRAGRWIYREKMRLLRTWWDGLTGFLDKQLEEHERNFDGTIKDLTDAFLADVRDGEGKFTREQIRANLMEMYIAAADTTTLQIQWLLMYMAEYQNVQKKVHQEIEENIGTKLPSMLDKKYTQYTEATINEVLRMTTLLFTGVARTNNREDFEIGSYKFRKRTPVIANYWSVHNDPEIFPNPGEFDPGHFLTQDGKKVTNLDKMVSFALGQRSCVGETLARIELYLFFVMFIQKFWIRAPKGTTVDLDPKPGDICEPSDFEIRLLPRLEQSD